MKINAYWMIESAKFKSIVLYVCPCPWKIWMELLQLIDKKAHLGFDGNGCWFRLGLLYPKCFPVLGGGDVQWAEWSLGGGHAQKQFMLLVREAPGSSGEDGVDCKGDSGSISRATLSGRTQFRGRGVKAGSAFVSEETDWQRPSNHRLKLGDTRAGGEECQNVSGWRRFFVFLAFNMAHTVFQELEMTVQSGCTVCTLYAKLLWIMFSLFFYMIEFV